MESDEGKSSRDDNELLCRIDDLDYDTPPLTVASSHSL